MGVSQRFGIAAHLGHTEIPSQCGATRSCGGVLSEIQLQARHRGLLGSSRLRFKSCAELSQADCKPVNVSSLKGLCSHNQQLLQPWCRASGALGEGMDGWVSINPETTLV